MKHSFKKSLLLVTIGLFQFILLDPVYASPVELVLRDSVSLNTASSNFTETAPLGKISIPNKNMIRKADNEIHRNMKADLAAASSLLRSWKGIISSDLNLNNIFYRSFSIGLPQNLAISDANMSHRFRSENLEIFYLKSLQIADLQINKTFYSSN